MKFHTYHHPSEPDDGIGQGQCEIGVSARSRRPLQPALSCGYPLLIPRIYWISFCYTTVLFQVCEGTIFFCRAKRENQQNSALKAICMVESNTLFLMNLFLISWRINLECIGEMNWIPFIYCVVFKNDMRRVLRFCESHLIAEDTVLSNAAKILYETFSQLNKHLRSLRNCLKCKAFKLNISKTKSWSLHEIVQTRTSLL